MNRHKLPITPTTDDSLPVIPLEKWRMKENDRGDQWIEKNYVFSSSEIRSLFVRRLLSYEDTVQHNAIMTITHDQVNLALQTHNLQKVTELDKEYAKFADSSFKDVICVGIESYT